MLSGPLSDSRINPVISLRLRIIDVVNFAHLINISLVNTAKNNKNKLSLHCFFQNINLNNRYIEVC